MGIKGHKIIFSEGTPQRKYDKKDIRFFAIHVRSKSDEYDLFIEVTSVKNFVWDIEARKIGEWYPEYAESWDEFLEESVWYYTYRRAKERLESKEYEEGEIYQEVITIDNFELWFREVKSLIDKPNKYRIQN
ncbi:hypothetical protein ES703_90083 [subsurface metagenome]